MGIAVDAAGGASAAELSASVTLKRQISPIVDLLSTLSWLVPLALLHGLLYLVLVPPWLHYDEPTHFLYAAEIAAGEFVQPGRESLAISREIADSMYRFRFFPIDWQPDLLSNEAPVVGIVQRVHPPLYYALVAMPLRVVSGLSIDLQLYIARALSVPFYVLTILAAWRIAVVVTPADTRLHVLVPLLVMLTPAFSDIMAAVNNDVLLNFSATVALLGAVLLVRDGLRPLPLALALLGLVVAFMTKRNAVVMLLPLAFAFLWSVRRAPLSWWVLPLLGLAVIGVFSVAVLQTAVVDGPLGPHTVLSVRPWFAAFDESYLRIGADAVVRSLSDPELIGDRYQGLIVIAFGGFYSHFGWGQVTLGPFWVWALAGLCSIATVGLVTGQYRFAHEMMLWQRRCLWLFVIAVIAAWISLFIRLHPLLPPGTPVYIPRGRYMFWAIVPNLLLLALGLMWLTPSTWRQHVSVGLLGFFVCMDLTAWLWSIVSYSYR
jgi:hypothetical protein